MLLHIAKLLSQESGLKLEQNMFYQLEAVFESALLKIALGILIKNNFC